MSGRLSNSSVLPKNRISPFSMNTAGSASRRALVTAFPTSLNVVPCSGQAPTTSMARRPWTRATPRQPPATTTRPTAPTPIADLFPPASAKEITPASEADGLNLLQQLNREHLLENPGDSRLEARIASYELAAKMQASAPEVLDISRETAQTHKLYALDDKNTEPFGRNCLVARRMLECGVCFVAV